MKRDVKAQTSTQHNIALNLVCIKNDKTTPPLTAITVSNISAVTDPILTKFQGPSLTDTNCHGEICPGNICNGNICKYQEYLSCYWTNFDQNFGGRNFYTKKLLNPNFFGAQSFLGATFFGPEFYRAKFFWIKDFLDRKFFFSDLKLLSLKILIGIQIIFGAKNSFGQKIFLGLK